MAIMNAAVFGSSGGIGRALVEALIRSGMYETVFAISRSGVAVPGAHNLTADFLDQQELADVAHTIQQAGVPGLCLIACGLLSAGDRIRPEKSYRHQSLDAFNEVFSANTFAPGLIAANLLPVMPRRERSVFAVLSARVGSISDNRLGGWHAYRASKAALNMLVRNYAIEQRSRAPGSICVALHPGTVETGLSRPFRSAMNSEKLLSPGQSADLLLKVISGLTSEHSGRCFDQNGCEIPP